MKNIALDTLKYYFSKMRAPTAQEIQSEAHEVLDTPGCCFVTIYHNGEIHGSAGNIKEIKSSLKEEILDNTIEALTKDHRFSPLTTSQAETVGIRVDRIEQRDMIEKKEFLSIDPLKNGVIAIARDYDTLGVLLPNISPKLLTGEDLISTLEKKMNKKSLDDSNTIFYKISTVSETTF